MIQKGREHAWPRAPRRHFPPVMNFMNAGSVHGISWTGLLWAATACISSLPNQEITPFEPSNHITSMPRMPHDGAWPTWGCVYRIGYAHVCLSKAFLRSFFTRRPTACTCNMIGREGKRQETTGLAAAAGSSIWILQGFQVTSARLTMCLLPPPRRRGFPRRPPRLQRNFMETRGS